ncbi:hypothetical protein ACP8HI_08765 [Paenibacillus sp. FA6]|uniref:hypothetical protein n=1 Tax=Paenibacillus sp. FA6 TaxID=3413029 RepID=UPI003F65BE66
MKTKVFLLVNLVSISLLIMFGNSMTTTPGRSSGNGNPAILLLIPLFLLFIVLIIQWINLLKNKKFSGKILTTTFVLIVIHFIVGGYYQTISYRKYRDFLAEVNADNLGNVDWQYINSITTGFSIHINNQFFNWNTYFLYVSLSIFIWLMSYIIKELVRSMNYNYTKRPSQD